MVASVSPEQLAKLRNNGQKVDLIDVRTPVEFKEVHIDFARNVPLDQLTPGAVTAGRVAGESSPIYVVCRSGSRGKQACEKLAAAGLNVVNVEGGTMAWDQAGLPVVRGGGKAISLERQVRIAAGLLVVLGSALGYFVHPYWIGLAAFVGAGLTFAGLTDTCGMGLMLARMPWNQQQHSCSTGSAATAPRGNATTTSPPA